MSTLDHSTNSPPLIEKRQADKRMNLSWVTIVFFGLHVGAAAAIFFPLDRVALVMLIALFFGRALSITAGYHRYFAHHSFKLNRFCQFCLAFVGGTCAQKGALWWVAHHRHHHIFSDTEEDVHSAKIDGFYWAHIGWIVSKEYHSYNPALVKDLAKFPELVWLNNYHFFPSALLAVICFAIDGWSGLFWGFFASTVLIYHATFAINSVCHMYGSRRYNTAESSRNTWWLSLYSLGENWHNNHHRHPRSSRHGLAWYELDLTFYTLKALSFFGIVRDLKVAEIAKPAPGVVSPEVPKPLTPELELAALSENP